MYHPVANTTFSYLLTLDEFRKTFSSDTMPSWVKITTITMISGFSEEVKIDIERNIVDSQHHMMHHYQREVDTTSIVVQRVNFTIRTDHSSHTPEAYEIY